MIKYAGNVTIKEIFLYERFWWCFFNQYRKLIRVAIVIAVVKMLSCKENVRGFTEYTCPKCDYKKICPHTCKSPFCSSCGKAATEKWINKQLSRMPDTQMRHITLTMPSQFRPLFWLNRRLLSDIFRAGANVFKRYDPDVRLGFFIALHTFGQQMNKNVHLHLCTTTGGLNSYNSQWIEVKFYKTKIMKMWRYEVTKALRDAYKKEALKLPKSLAHIKDYNAFNSWLNVHYKKHWVVDISQPTNKYAKIIRYIGRYLKRPVIGNTRIKFFDGKIVKFSFKDHHDGKIKNLALPIKEFVERLIQHIPDRHFKMIRYYGFLSNKLCGKLLPKVYELLSLAPPENDGYKIHWRLLHWETYGIDPIMCPHCNILMEMTKRVQPENLYTILSFHKFLACRK